MSQLPSQPAPGRQWRRRAATSIGLIAAALLAPSLAAAQDLAAFEKRTTVHTLANGWTFILVEQPGAPVFSFATVVDVGSAQEVLGITGLAHMFEHMAFKGSPHIGTTDYDAEKVALAAQEEAYLAWQAERLSPHPDAARLAGLEQAFRERTQAAEQYVVRNEFPSLIDREGGNGMNAATGADSTTYYYSLPVNKLELFCYLESERFLHPVFRQFYQERDVVKEERRLGVENNPLRKLLEQMISAAFVAHPYQHSTVGSMSDLDAITMTDAQSFFDTYYAPSNLVTAIVGAIDHEKVIPLLEQYFGRIPARPAPLPLRSVEPPQGVEKTVVLRHPAQPMYLEAYHKPAITHPDQAVYMAIDDILSNGRTSRLYRSLVRDQRLAVAVRSFTGLPGDKYPGLWLVLAVPARGVSLDQVQQAIRSEITRLRDEDVSDAELARFRTRTRAELVRSLDDASGLAEQLAEHQRLFGDWRMLFRSLEQLAAVTKADIRRVAQQTFMDSNRIVGKVESDPAAGRPGAQGPTTTHGGR